jgi:PAS domain S-box-containing protein
LQSKWGTTIFAEELFFTCHSELHMKVFIRIWNRISSMGIKGIPEKHKRTVILLNRVNFFIIAAAFLGLCAALSDSWLFHGGKPGTGTIRLVLILISGIISFLLTLVHRLHVARIVSSILPGFLLIIFPTLLGDVRVEYYFYYPLSGIAFAMVPILIFPEQKERFIMILLVLYCFLLTITSDNLLSFFSSSGKLPEFFKGSYAFYKLSQVLLFAFIVLTIFTLQDANTRHEMLLDGQNKELQSQKKKLEQYKINLEGIVEARTVALRTSETRFRSIFERANDAILIMKEDVFVNCNLKTTEMFARNKESIIGSTPWAFSPPLQPDGRDSKEKAFEKINATLKGEPQRFEWQHIRSDGSPFDAEVSLSSLKLEGDLFLLAVVRDITERRKTMETLKASERNFRNVFNKTRHGIIICDQDLKILAANDAALQLTVYNSLDDSPLYLSSFVQKEQQVVIRERLKKILQGEKLVPIEYKVKFKDNLIHIVEAETSVMDYYGQEVFLIMLRDVTHIREAEYKIMEAIINTEENERSRIAQDLHDGLGPVLSTIKLYFQVYQDSVDPDKKALLADKLKNTIDESIRGVSEISHNISPHVLRNYGFYAALKQFIYHISLTNVVQIKLHCSQEPYVDQNTGIILYRAVTELINNSLKHSGCENISISCSKNENYLKIEYADDGKGFDATAVVNRPGKGSGVQNIINRIKALQGTVDIQSTAGNGMQAKIEISM